MSQAEIVAVSQEQDVQERSCQECYLLPAAEQAELAENCPVLAALEARAMKPPTEEALSFMMSQPSEVPISLVALKKALMDKTSDNITKEVAYARMRSAKRVVAEEFGDGVFVLEGETRNKTQVFYPDVLKHWCEQAPPPEPEKEAVPKPKAMRLPASFRGKSGLPGMQAIFYNYVMKASDDLDEAEEQGLAVAEMALQAEVDPVLVHITISKALKEVLSDKNIDTYRRSLMVQDRFAFAAQLAERASRGVKKEQ